MDLLLCRIIKRGGHTTATEQTWVSATEVHHRPGSGVSPELFYKILELLDLLSETQSDP